MQRVHRTIGEMPYDREIPVLRPQDPVSLAVEAMQARRCNAALVAEFGRLVGIFTSRDFVFRVLGKRRSPDDTKMAEVMTARPQALRLEDSVSYAIQRMAVDGYRNVPIIDGDDAPIGILSSWHVIDHMGEILDEIDPEDPARARTAELWIDTGGGG